MWMAEHLTRTESMCPRNEDFVDTGRVHDIHTCGVRCDIVRFRDGGGRPRLGFYARIRTDMRRDWLAIQVRKLDSWSQETLYHADVDAASFIESWEYVFPELRSQLC